MSDEDESDSGLSPEEDFVAKDTVPHLQLEGNTYTYAFACAVRARGIPYAFLLFITSVAAANILTYSVWSHTTHQEEREQNFIDRVAAESVGYALYGPQQRLSQGKSELICGEFYRSRQRLASNHSKFYYEKHPVNDWNPRTFFGDCMLDDALSVYELSTEFPQNLEFSFIFFFWTLAVCIEGQDIFSFCMVLWGLLKYQRESESESSDGRLLHRVETSRLGEAVYVSRSAILMGMVVVITRAATCMFLAPVGAQFLLATTSKVDLILNALALGFILQLDDMIYKVCVSSKLQEEETCKKVCKTSEDAVYGSSRKDKVKWGGPPRMIFCMSMAALALWHQAREARGAVVSLASICLFMGPTPHESLADQRLAATFPVPGFCESLISATCDVPERCLSAFADGSLAGDCISYGAGFNCSRPNIASNFHNNMVAKMQQICQNMWQPLPQMLGLDGTVGPMTHFRETDTAAGDRDFAAPFWCSFAEDHDVGVGQFFSDLDQHNQSNWVWDLFFNDDSLSRVAHCSTGPLRWRSLTSYPSMGTFPDERNSVAV